MAARKRPNAWGLALVPFLFGVHQISEGFVWLGLVADDKQFTQTASLVYLFFALAFWPFWFPFFGMLMEPRPVRKRIMIGFCVLATGWFWVLYYPVVVEPTYALTTKEVHHSIQYEMELPIYDYYHVPKMLMRVLYALTLAVPFVLSSEGKNWVPGAMLGLSVLICFLLYSYAFVSVWCFFAAVMSGYVGWIFYTLPARR